MLTKLRKLGVLLGRKKQNSDREGKPSCQANEEDTNGSGQSAELSRGKSNRAGNQTLYHMNQQERPSDDQENPKVIMLNSGFDGTIHEHRESNGHTGGVHLLDDTKDQSNNDFWKKRIEDNRLKIMEWLDLETTLLLDHLIQLEVVTTEQVDIMSVSNHIEKKRWLLNYLLRRPKEDFDKFCDSLENTNQSHIARFLQREPQKQIKMKIRFTPPSQGHDALNVSLTDFYIDLDKLPSHGKSHLNIILQTDDRRIEEVREGCIEIIISCDTVHALDELWDLTSQGEIGKAVTKDLIEIKGIEPEQTSSIEVTLDYQGYLTARMSLWDPTRDGPWEKDLRPTPLESSSVTPYRELYGSQQNVEPEVPTIPVRRRDKQPERSQLSTDIPTYSFLRRDIEAKGFPGMGASLEDYFELDTDLGHGSKYGGVGRYSVSRLQLEDSMEDENESRRTCRLMLKERECSRRNRPSILQRFLRYLHRRLLG